MRKKRKTDPLTDGLFFSFMFGLDDLFRQPETHLEFKLFQLHFS